MNISDPNGTMRLGRCIGEPDQQLLMQCAQIKLPIEAKAEGGEVTRNVFVEIEVTPTTGQTGLEIAMDVMIHQHSGTSFGLRPSVTGG